MMKWFKKYIYDLISKKFMNGCSHYNSLKVRKYCRSKAQARRIFKENNVPHAEGEIFFSPFTAFTFAQKTGFPLVIKPNVGGFSRGSHFPIQDWKHFWWAVFIVKIWWPTSVIESYLKGKNYRVVVANGELMVINERFPPFIMGDGKKNISDLINEENSIRREMKLLPTIHEIPKDSKIKRFLKSQKLNLNSIPEKNKRIELYHRIALVPGGSLKNIDLKSITPKNQKLFCKILKDFNAVILGIDVIAEKGLDTDLDAQKCIFLEVNSRPYLKMHDFPRYGEKPDLTKAYKRLNRLKVKDKHNF